MLREIVTDFVLFSFVEGLLYAYMQCSSIEYVNVRNLIYLKLL